MTYPSDCMAKCIGMDTAYKGECSFSRKCIDSDGSNSSIKGVVTTEGRELADYCKRFESVEEYYCDGDNAKIETITCPAGTECRDGSCVEKTMAFPSPDCTDSDGQDPYTKGIVSAFGKNYTDSCADFKTLIEFYCDEAGVRSTSEDCPPFFRCDNGACIKPGTSCNDTDWGRDIYQEGMVSVGTLLTSAQYLDKCVDDRTVREYYCQASGMVEENIDCPAGFKCINAACKEEACTDSDDGISITKSGAISKGSEVQKDECIGETNLVEFYCDGQNIMNATLECPAGNICKDGRCEGG